MFLKHQHTETFQVGMLRRFDSDSEKSEFPIVFKLSIPKILHKRSMHSGDGGGKRRDFLSITHLLLYLGLGHLFCYLRLKFLIRIRFFFCRRTSDKFI